jgi:hypothetical protein
MNRIGMALLLAVLAACTQNFHAPEQVVTSRFEKTATVAGETMQLPGGESGMARLVSIVPKGQPAAIATHTAFVQILYSRAWRFYEGANAEGGAALPFMVISRNAGGCSASSCAYDEQFAATLDAATMRAAGMAGISIKFYSKAGASMIVTFPSQVVARQLVLADSVAGSRGTPIRK